MATKVPRSIRLLAQHGKAALSHRIENGKYIPPLISKRIGKAMRKRSIVDGTYGSFSATQGGWDPAWDEPGKMFMLRPYRGHLRERNRDARATKITQAMEKMPKRISDMEADIASRKPVKDIGYLFKRVAAISSRSIRK